MDSKSNNTPSLVATVTSLAMNRRPGATVALTSTHTYIRITKQHKTVAYLVSPEQFERSHNDSPLARSLLELPAANEGIFDEQVAAPNAGTELPECAEQIAIPLDPLDLPML